MSMCAFMIGFDQVLDHVFMMMPLTLDVASVHPHAYYLVPHASPRGGIYFSVYFSDSGLSLVT